MILFHGTSDKFLRPIMRKGILPRAQTNRSTYDGDLVSNPDRIYLTDVYPLQFALHAVEKHGGNILVAAVEVNEEILEPDTDFAEGGLASTHFISGLKCLQSTGCISVTSYPLRPHRMWVVSKKLQNDLVAHGSLRIATGFRHQGFYQTHKDQLEYFLMMGKRYTLRNSVWLDEYEREVCNGSSYSFRK